MRAPCSALLLLAASAATVAAFSPPAPSLMPSTGRLVVRGGPGRCAGVSRRNGGMKLRMAGLSKVTDITKGEVRTSLARTVSVFFFVSVRSAP